MHRGGRKVNEFLNRKFSDLCELCLCLKVFAACVNFPIYEASRIRIFLPPRREERQVRINIISLSLRPLRRRSGHALRLCGKYPDSFGCGAAACASAVNTSQSRVSRISKLGICFCKRFDLSEAVKRLERWNGLVCWLTQDQLIGYAPPKTAIRGLVRPFH